MSNDPGLSISRPVPVSKKLSSIRINYRDFTKALGKAGVDLSFGKWDSLAGDGVEALTALGISAGAGEIAWLLVYRSMLQAMKSLVDEKTEIAPERFKPKELKVAIDQALVDSSLSIDREFFTHPGKAAVVGLVQPSFINWLVAAGVFEADARAISQRLPIYFAAALHQEWGDRAKDYGALKEKLDTPFTQANDRAQAWARYGVWLQKQVEEPLFLEAFSLKQVFVPLRAYYHRKIAEPGERGLDERLEGKKNTERIVVDLESELISWLAQAKKDDAIRLISGGPGSGKSSLTKMFAARLAAEGNIPTLFVPLHHFEPSNDLIEAVGRFVKLDGFLNFNPLETEYREERLLIIFDGLDELAMQGKVGENTAVDFVREVQRKVDRINQQKTCLQVLIDGRELVVQANDAAFRQEGQILHVLPYLVAEDEDDHLQYVDPEHLLGQDQRQLWWEYYGKASGNGFMRLPPQLDRGNLDEITAQPLLNYLVALSLHYGKLEFSEETNLNSVYDNLLRSVYARGWESNQHSAIQGVEEKDFVRILEEIALATWHGNGRTTTIKEIESHCIHSGLKELLNRFQRNFRDNPQASVTRLLTAFYFRRSDSDSDDNKTFEFTHKSFGEYLTAKRIIREVRLIHKKLISRKSDPDEGCDEREALHRWVVLCSLTTMDEYLFNFIMDEVRLHYQLSSAEVCEWQQTFCSLIGFMLCHGLPMERLIPRPIYQEEFRQALNAEDSLLAVLGAFQRITQEISNIEFPTLNAFGLLLSRLRGQRTSSVNPLSFHCLSHLNLSGCNLAFRDLHNADLIGANLSGTHLIGANLIGANLSEADLSEANLSGTHLSRANLSRANLSRADLSEANLSEANLSEANLSRAYLSKAYLSKANLSEANLSEANLSRASLSEANLSEANLSKASLSEANLSKANLSEANLNRADLSVSYNLTPEQFNSARSTQNTHLPNYFYLFSQVTIIPKK
jgi:uncharacterized protein YjbI with pentapeptide repeats